MVSPGNPLKPAHGMAPFAERLAVGARASPTAAAWSRPASRRRSAPATPSTPCERCAGAFRSCALRLADGRRQSAAVAALACAGWRSPRPCLRGAAAPGLHASARSRAQAAQAASPRAATCGLARHSRRSDTAAWMFLPAAQHAASATAIRTSREGAEPSPESRPSGSAADGPKPGPLRRRRRSANRRGQPWPPPTKRPARRAKRQSSPDRGNCRSQKRPRP